MRPHIGKITYGILVLGERKESQMQQTRLVVDTSTIIDVIVGEPVKTRLIEEMVAINILEAVQLADTFNIYAYDAYILQCAIEQNIPVISLDQHLIRVAKDAGIAYVEVN